MRWPRSIATPRRFSRCAEGSSESLADGGARLEKISRVKTERNAVAQIDPPRFQIIAFRRFPADIGLAQIVAHRFRRKADAIRFGHAQPVAKVERQVLRQRPLIDAVEETCCLPNATTAVQAPAPRARRAMPTAQNRLRDNIFPTNSYCYYRQQLSSDRRRFQRQTECGPDRYPVAPGRRVAVAQRQRP